MWSARVERTGDRVDKSALWLRRGLLLLLARAKGDENEAELCMHEALAIARRQRARLLELSAATALAQLRQQHGRRQEALELLEPIYAWFSEM
jgi:hypothetical protein